MEEVSGGIMTYSEQIKHPKWQKRRLQIMEKAGFRCENCGTDEVTLNVHHILYRDGYIIWEYADEDLVCLCEDCHGIAHEIIKNEQADTSTDSEEYLKHIYDVLWNHGESRISAYMVWLKKTIIEMEG
jgi:hypothetical protein